MVANSRKATQKSILFYVMEGALEDAGYFSTTAAVVTQRDLYYSARELYYVHPNFPEVETRLARMYEKKGKTKQGGPAAIDYDYFSKVLTEWEDANGKLNRLIRDVRGHLYEPHSGKTIEIGTLSVREYEFPEYVFDKLLYIEKEGEMAKVREARIAERYDMAILTGKGFPTEAIRNLLSMASKGQDYQIFCFHDADDAGYDIARALREETRRMPGYCVDVIDLGLTYGDAEAMKLQGEPYTRQKRISEALIPLLTPRELEIMMGTKVGRNTYHSYRYEINTLKPVNTRMDYIERKLRQNGVRPKVIPPDDYLHEKLTNRRDRDIASEIGMAIDRIVGRDRIVNCLTEQFRDDYGIEDAREWIEEGFKDNRQRSWESIATGRIEASGYQIRNSIEDAVRKAIVSRLTRRS
jgi:hypothetical protein